MGKITLGEVAIESKATWKSDKVGVPIVGLEHLEPDEITLSNWEIDSENTFTKKFSKGQVLLGRRRVYLRKAVIAPVDGICSGDITVIEAIPGKILPELLPFVIQNDKFFDYAVQGSAGSLSPRVKWEHLKKYSFELPSIDEQKILANKLWAAYRLKESYKKLLSATDEMVKSQFIELFWGGKYTMKKLRGHIEVLRGVSYKPSDVHEDLSDNTSIVLRSNNIDGGQVNFDDLVYVDSERVSEHQVLNAGDIVMCGSNGSKKLVGKAALLSETPRENTSFGAFCFGIRCKSSIIPEYLATYFQTSLYRDKIEALGSGSNILNIKPDHIYDIEIPIPSLGEQETFVSIVKQADKSKFELRQVIDKIDRVIKSSL